MELSLRRAVWVRSNYWNLNAVGFMAIWGGSILPETGGLVMHVGKDKKNIQGFTLAELLTAIAILLILAAIAMPSIISAQKNMLMTELDASAAQIAQAAQNQMTSKKVSGTWMSTLDKLEIATKQKAEIAGQSGLYYFTADQARENGILPRNSIDDVVYEGDFVIEFNMSTATVSRVFFADGRTGFFGSSADPTGKALSYYNKGAGSSIKDDRQKNTPPMGFYQGTPAGATNTVALAEPVIWVSEVGRLCIQNPNLSNTFAGKSWATNSILKFTVTQMNEDGSEGESITIDGLQGGGGPVVISVSAKDGLSFGPYTLTGGDSDLIERMSRDGGSTVDSFGTDLRGLLDLVGARGPEWQAITDTFTDESSIRVFAEVYTKEKPCEPASATAFIKFPNLTPRLAVLVTDAAYLKEGETRANHITGSYKEPEVHLHVYKDAGTEVNDTILKADEEDVRDIVGTGSVLINKNSASAYQAYTGASLEIKQTSDPTIAYMQADAGGYNNYTYQIFEIWINSTKVGFLRNNAWTWAMNGNGTSYELLEARGAIFDRSNTGLKIRPSLFEGACAELGIVADENDGYAVYLRTTPNVSDVDTYLREPGVAEEFWQEARSGGGVNSSRGTSNPWDRHARERFENRFGVPSSVASWTATTNSETGIEGFLLTGWHGYYKNEPLRIYYAGTPAVGFEDGTLDQTVFEKNELLLENTKFWYFVGNERAFLTDGMVQRPYDSGADGNPLSLTADEANNDFMIPYKKDKLFYRVLFHFDDGNSLSGVWNDWRYNQWTNAGWNSPQIIPYSHQNESEYKFANIPSEPIAKTNKIFYGWVTNGTYSGAQISLASSDRSGLLVGDYNGMLKMGRIDLHAHYEAVTNDKIGMVYYERYNETSEIGYYGYVDEWHTINTLKDDTYTVKNWGYWALGSTRGNSSDPNLEDVNGNTIAKLKHPVGIYINGSHYRAYDLVEPLKGNAKRNETIRAKLRWNQGNYNVFYSFNLNFAQMVETDEVKASRWGQDNGDPWKVRHYNQFPGCIDSAVYANQSAYGYQDDNYLQTHDIDFKGQNSLPSYGQDSVFQGTYDGAEHRIKNYSNLRSNSTNGSSGLFFNLNGTINNPVALKNIRLDYSDFGSTTLNVSLQGGTQQYFGLLAGIATNTTLENCIVSGKVVSGYSENPLNISITTNSGGDLCFGGLIGYAENCSFTDCGIYDVVFESKTARQSGKGLYMGSLAGYMAGASAEGKVDSKIARSADHAFDVLANKILLKASHPTENNEMDNLYIGALVGSVEAGIDIGQGALEDFTKIAFTSISKQVNGAAQKAVTTAIGVAESFVEAGGLDGQSLDAPEEEAPQQDASQKQEEVDEPSSGEDKQKTPEESTTGQNTTGQEADQAA